MVLILFILSLAFNLQYIINGTPIKKEDMTTSYAIFIVFHRIFVICTFFYMCNLGINEPFFLGIWLIPSLFMGIVSYIVSIFSIRGMYVVKLLFNLYMILVILMKIPILYEYNF